MDKNNKESSFSIELKSKEHIRTFGIANGNGSPESVIVEGTIGQLQHAEFAECIVLEIIGTKGSLRIDLSPEEIQGKNKIEVKKQ